MKYLRSLKDDDYQDWIKEQIFVYKRNVLVTGMDSKVRSDFLKQLSNFFQIQIISTPREFEEWKSDCPIIYKNLLGEVRDYLERLENGYQGIAGVHGMDLESAIQNIKTLTLRQEDAPPHVIQRLNDWIERQIHVVAVIHREADGRIGGDFYGWS